MPYYGVGDYYMGDPGRIGGFIGAALKGLAGLGVRVLKRTPVGAAVGAAVGVAGAMIRRPPVAPPTGIPLPGPYRAQPGAIFPGGAPFITRETAPGGTCPPGFHLNKARSYRYDMPPKSYCVRNRAMNPANPRALRRGIRREQRFTVLARRALRGTGITIGRRSFGKKKARR